MSLAEAVVELRRRHNWSQKQLAQETGNENSMRRFTAPSVRTIQRWEIGQVQPGEMYRIALARVAHKYGHDDLAQIFHQNQLIRQIQQKRLTSEKLVGTNKGRNTTNDNPRRRVTPARPSGLRGA